MKTPAEEAILLIVWAINLWMMATGNPSRIAARDIVVTCKDGVWFLAFQEARPPDRAK